MWKANKTNGELWRQKVSFKKLLVKRNFFMVQVETYYLALTLIEYVLM